MTAHTTAVTLDPVGDVGVSVPRGEFAARAPELAAFGALRLGRCPPTWPPWRIRVFHAYTP